MRNRVTKTATFEAAHQLPWHPGKCQRLHGHHYRVEVSVEGPLDAHGIVVDFDELGRALDSEVVARFDHQYLNELIDNPTAEAIAAEIWKRVEASGLPVVRVAVWETPDSVAELLAD